MSSASSASPTQEPNPPLAACPKIDAVHAPVKQAAPGADPVTERPTASARVAASANCPYGAAAERSVADGREATSPGELRCGSVAVNAAIDLRAAANVA